MNTNGLKHLTRAERQTLDALITRLRRKYPKQIEQVILFGSRARGDATPESDFDLLIVTKNGGKKLEERLSHFAALAGDDFHLVVFADVIGKRAFSLKRTREPFYRSIASEGIDLLGKTPRRLSHGKPLVCRPRAKGFKMKEQHRIQIQIRLERAYDYLAEARTLFENKMFPGTVSRAYYAVLTLTTAVLLTLDLVRAKQSGVESAFSEYFIRDKRIEEEYKDIFVKSRYERERADYKYKEYTEEQAQEILADCERFVARMEKYLRDVGAIQ